jgi:hypothetical protein
MIITFMHTAAPPGATVIILLDFSLCDVLCSCFLTGSLTVL